MTNKEYIDGVLRTEAPVTPELVNRFNNQGAHQLLQTCIHTILQTGDQLDALKKFYFYGKALPHTENVVVQPLSPSDLLVFLDPGNVRILHALIGIVTEAAEFMQAWKILMDGGKLDRVNLIEEAGDQFWYLGILADALESSFEDMQERNNLKLRKRYPAAFTETEALTRDLGSERAILEKQ